MRSLHPRPYSRFDNRVEQVAERANSLCLYLILGGFFALLLMNSQPYQHKSEAKAKKQQVASVWGVLHE